MIAEKAYPINTMCTFPVVQYPEPSVSFFYLPDNICQRVRNGEKPSGWFENIKWAFCKASGKMIISPADKKVCPDWHRWFYAEYKIYP